MKRLTIATCFVAFVMASGCARTVVYRASGEPVVGKLMQSGPDEVVIQTRPAKVRVAVQRPDGSVRLHTQVEQRLLRIPREDLVLLERENKVALGFAIAGTLVTAAGLVGLAFTQNEFDTCTAVNKGGFACLGKGLARVSMIGLAATGASVAIPSWIVWGATKRTEQGPSLRLNPGGLSGTF